MAAGSEQLVLKISADTAAVASGLAPMTDALDKLGTGADEASKELSKLDTLTVKPTVDDAGLTSAAGSLEQLDRAASDVTGTLGELDREKVSPDVDKSKLDDLQRAAEDSGDQLGKLADPVTLSVRDQALQRAAERIDELRDEIAEDVAMGVDTTDAVRELNNVEKAVRELTEEPQTIDVEVNPEDADFAFESMAKLKRGVRGLTDAILEAGDGLKAVPDLVSAGVGSFTTLNASMSGFIERQQAAGGTVGRFTSGLGRVTGFLAGPWGLAIGGGITVLGAMVGQIGEADEATMDFAKSLDYNTGALDRNNRVKAATLLRGKDLFGTMRDLGLSTAEFTRAVAGDATSVQRLIGQLNALDAEQAAIIRNNQMAAAQADTAGLEAAEKAKTTQTKIALLRGTLHELTGAETDVIAQSKELNEAIGDTGDVSAVAASGVDKSVAALQKMPGELTHNAALWRQYGDRVDESRKALDEIVDSLDILNGRFVSAREAAINYEESIDGMSEAIKENGKAVTRHGKAVKDQGDAFDTNSEKGRANEKALMDAAAASEELATARLEDADASGESSAKILADYEKQRNSLIRTAEKMGLSHTAAKKYVDKLLETPDELKTQVELKGYDKAKGQLDSLTGEQKAVIDVSLNLDKFYGELRRRTAGSRFEWEGGGASAQSAPTPPPVPTPRAGLTLLQPRLFLDSRPIRYALRNDVASTVSHQLAATRTRGRL